MKTQKEIEAALKKYEQLLEKNQRIKDFEDDFLQSHDFMQDKESHVVSAIRWYEASLAVASCERLIKNCKWMLDIK